MGNQNKSICIQPATRWEDAHPIGNGTIGALIHGNISNEKIIFNHEALWFKYPKKDIPYIGDNLEELREMLLDGEWNHTDKFLNIMLLEKGYVAQEGFALHKDRYHPAFTLNIETPPQGPFREYSRVLNFESGEVSVAWEENGTKTHRSCFISRENDIFCMKIENLEQAFSSNIQLAMTDFTEENHHFKNKNLKREDIPLEIDIQTKLNEISFVGTYSDGNQYGGLLRLVLPSNTTQNLKLIQTPHTAINISDVNQILIFVKIFAHIPSETALNQIRKEFDEMELDYDALLSTHTSIHKELYDRQKFELETDSTTAQDLNLSVTDQSNEMLLLKSYNGTVSHDLIERMFNYGRYLLIASSRPNGWPANLQGIWNAEYTPAWESDFHNDENIQMNYWLALPGNLQEATLPYFDFYEASIPDYQKNAKAVFNCRGIMAPIAQTIKGSAPLYGGPWLNWTAGAGWLAQLFYDYYLFTRDTEFLKTHAIPFLKQVALFYEDFLIRGENGKYMFCPSLSPENVPDIKDGSLVTINSTMDIAIAKEILLNLCEGCEILEIEEENRNKWKAMIQDLPEYEINEDGAMKEWLYPGLKDNYHHRHQSHIYPLFPGFEITEENNPEIYQACQTAVEKRLIIGQESQSGWSLAHMANIYARLRDSEHAIWCIESMIRSCVGPNLFTYHNDWRHQGLTLFWDFKDRIFQIDANFGITAALLEMLLFSNREMIKILPAIPTSWKKGSITGIKTRCCVTVSIDWNFNENQLKLRLEPSESVQITMRFPKKIRNISVSRNTLIETSKYGEYYRKITIQSREPIKITCNFE